MNIIHLKPRYELNHWDGKELITMKINHEELADLDFESVDHFHSKCLGVFQFKSVRGNRIVYKKKWPNMGPVSLPILHAIQFNTGVYLSTHDLVALTGNRLLKNKGVLPARIARLRNTHKEVGSPYFIQTSKAGGYHIRWPGELTWMTIDRVPPRVPFSA